MPLSKQLLASALQKDPRIDSAKQLILEAIADHQKEIKTIRPAKPELKQKYEDCVQLFGDYRGNPLGLPYIGSGLGNGALVELADGSIKYDFISGVGVHFFGHNHPALTEATIDSALSDIPLQGHLQQNIDNFELSKILIETSTLPHCFISASGAMALENALKSVFQKKFPSYRLLAFERCFAGRTLALAQVTDKPSYREGLPQTLEVDYVPFYDPKRPEESLNSAMRALKGHIARYPKGHCAMIFELIQGEGGFYPGTREFFAPLMQLCKENELAIIVDEVQTFGRTSELFAFQHFNLEDYVDICSIGKLSQVCATLFKDEWNPKPGLLSQTVLSSTSAIKCSISVLKMLVQSDLYGKNGKNMRMHALFVKEFERIAQRHPGSIKGPYGLGGMIAFTFFEGDANKSKQFVNALFDAGLICFLAGSQPTRIRMLPPIPVLQEEDVKAAAQIIENCLSYFP